MTLRRKLFILQAPSNKNCFRYTGVKRPKLDLIFNLVEDKSKNLQYWRGSVDTRQSRRKKKEKT